jgi:NAD(P)-dependent dehydrogenase (short-subunit alcohol dehydrogenase family)
MQRLSGRVAIVTGAGRGLGRSHALCLAGEGAQVVVNDVGVDHTGRPLAECVAQEIVGAGGSAIADTHDISQWDGASAVIERALATFGDLHVLVNNAGIVRDRTLARMSEAEWDDVIRVNLKGHAAPSAHALRHWRSRAKQAGQPVRASIVHTTSVAGLMGHFGQANYAAAKLGVVALSLTIALEGAAIGVRSNAIAPSARTPTVLENPTGLDVLPPSDGSFDYWDPANVSPVVAWLAEAECTLSGQVLQVAGNALKLFSMPTPSGELTTEGRWTLDELARQVPDAAPTLPDIGAFLAELAEQGARRGADRAIASAPGRQARRTR